MKIVESSDGGNTSLGNELNNMDNKIDSVKNEAINSANNTLTTTIANYYTKTQTDSQINVAKNAITQSVSENYYSKNEYSNSSTLNLIKNGGFEDGTNHWSRNGDFTDGKDVWFPYDDSASWVIWASTQSGFYQFFNCKIGRTYSWSVDVYVEHGYFRAGVEDMSEEWFHQTDGWVKMKGNFIATRETHAFILYAVENNTTVHFDNVMINEGAVNQPFQLSYIDINNRLKSAEQKITSDAIINTVKEEVYTKTETENAITSKGYATQAQLTQTSTQFEYKFSQTGGYNLIRNGNPKPNNYSHWWVSGNANWYLGSTTDIGVQTIDTNEAYAGSATFKVEPGKTYSFSCWLMAESNTKGTDVYFIGSANDDGAYTEVHHLFTSGSCGWTQVKKTFTVGSNINYGFIRIDNNGRKDTSNGAFTVVFFSEVMLVKGQDYFPQWSPNPNEVYDGITTIDKSGIKVSASNINGYAKMTANGFFVNKDGKDLVSVDGYGLRLFDAKIQLTHANGNKYFLLDENGIVMYNPENGTHQWGKLGAINSKFTVASNGNSSGLSLGHHVNENYVEDILCDSSGVVTVQRQMNHNGVFYNNYGQMFVRQSGQGGWEITGRSDSQSIKPGGANQGSIGSDTQYINQSWIANRYNPSSLEIKHLSHYVDDLECLKLVSEVQPARYFYKEYDEDGNDITTFTTKTSQLGLIYEDVRECSGRDLLTNEDDKAINDYNMSAILWGATRNINRRLNDVEYENFKLGEQCSKLKQENESLKEELSEIKQMLMQVLNQKPNCLD